MISDAGLQQGGHSVMLTLCAYVDFICTFTSVLFVLSVLPQYGNLKSRVFPNQSDSSWFVTTSKFYLHGRVARCYIVLTTTTKYYFE